MTTLIVFFVLIFFLTTYFVLSLEYSGDLDVEPIGNFTTFGSYTSLVLDSNDKAHMVTISPPGSWCDIGNVDPCLLTYGNNTVGAWGLVNVTTDNRTVWPSIAIDSNDKTHIAYINRSGSDWNLNYCNNTAGVWGCYEVFWGSLKRPSIAIDTNDKVHIIVVNGTLAYGTLAYCNNTVGSWSCTNIPLDKNKTSTTYPRMALDSNNKVHVVALDYDGYNYALFYCNNTVGAWGCDKLVDAKYQLWNPSGPKIITDSNDIIHLMYTNATSLVCPTYGYSYITYMNSSNWSIVNKLTKGCMGGNGIEIDANDKIHIIYSESSYSYYLSNIKGDFSSSTLTWNISGVGPPKIKKGLLTNGTSFSDYVHFLHHDKVGGSYDGTYYAKMLIDTTPPNVTINVPLNQSYATTNITFNVTAVDETSVSSCWYTINNGDTNSTMTNSSGNTWIHTNSSMSQGSHTAKFYCNDTYILGGNLNDTEQNTFFIDSIIPQITLVYPTNTSYNSVQTELNYSYSDTNVDACWYSTDGGATNTTDATCTNLTGLNSGQGSSTWLVGINDTLNNTNYSIIQFFVDSITPIPSISYPANSTYATNVSELNYTYTETNPNRCWYSTNGGATNASDVACGTNFTTITSIEGSNTWILSMNDTLGNENSTSVTFFKDSIYPQISITSPANNTNTTDTGLNITYTYTEVNCDTVWWENGTLGANTTLASCGDNITTEVWGEGKHNVTVFMNDTANNVNQSYVSFTIDTTNPQIDYGANIEINNSNVTVSYIFVNVTVTEINEKNITFLLYNQTAQSNLTIFTDGTRTINWTGLNDDRYTYNVTIYDYANNTNTTATRTITLDSTSPIITVAYPQYGASYINNDSISLNYTVTDPLVGVDACWYNVYNSTGDEVIANTIIVNCVNTTFALVAGDVDYNLTLYSNDSLNNTNSSIVEFGIRTIKPAIALDSPNNDEWFASGTNIYFNYTATDDDGLDTCQLWGNWTGTWHKNYTWVDPTSGVQNYTTVTIPEVISIWSIWCNDTLNNKGFSVNNFTLNIDETNPIISYEPETPADYSNLSQSNIYVNVTWIEINLANIIFSLYNDTATVNSTTFTTVTYDINWTGLNDDNNYTYEVNITDNANNKNYTSVRHITLDTGNPDTNLTTPANNTNTSTVAQNMTTNISDALGIKNATLNIYNQTSGNLINSTITSFAADILTKTLGIVYTFLDGIYDWFYKVFDWAGNSAESGNYTITIDTTTPQITLVYPTNTSYNAVQTELNYSYSDSGVGVIDGCWYSTDGGATNITDATCTNLTGLNSGQGSSTWLVGINDTANNRNDSIVQFFVDTIEPSISLDAPTNHQNISNGSDTYFNYTATDVGGLDTCQLWGNWTGTWHKNYTWVGSTSGVQNYTTQNITEGRFKYNVWCNDTLNNVNWSASNYTFTIDETNPNVTITTTNNTQVTDTLSITIDYNISDTYLKECYFTLRTTGGLVHNYPENTSLNCVATSRSISTLWYGTFVVQFWGEDYTGNLDDANLTFTTYYSGAGPGGGNGEPIVVEEEVVVTKSFCGDGICQIEGNDYGIREDWYNCQIDCQPFDFDALIYSFTKYCFDDDVSTVCFWSQMLFATVPGMGEEIVKDKTVYKDGQVCIGEICERLSGKTLFSNCVDADPTTPCFWKSNAAFFILFLGGSTAFALTFVRVRVSGRREKVNPYKYLQLKVKGRKKRKWR